MQRRDGSAKRKPMIQKHSAQYEREERQAIRQARAERKERRLGKLSAVKLCRAERRRQRRQFRAILASARREFAKCEFHVGDKRPSRGAA